MKVRPLHDRLLVRRIEEEHKTAPPTEDDSSRRFNHAR
jgi:hypothetical protein